MKQTTSTPAERRGEIAAALVLYFCIAVLVAQLAIRPAIEFITG